MKRTFVFGVGLLGAFISLPKLLAQPKIDRNVFGQFAENLGRGLYEGIWGGIDSSIPNTRGIRIDVVAALKGQGMRLMEVHSRVLSECR